MAKLLRCMKMRQVPQHWRESQWDIQTMKDVPEQYVTLDLNAWTQEIDGESWVRNRRSPGVGCWKLGVVGCKLLPTGVFVTRH